MERSIRIVFLTSFVKKLGLSTKLQHPTLHKKNGVSERKNRSIMEMARCLLHEKNLPKNLWAEAANTTIFLLNRLPTRVLQKKTPFEA
jgi:hypothetical protein